MMRIFFPSIKGTGGDKIGFLPTCINSIAARSECGGRQGDEGDRFHDGGDGTREGSEICERTACLQADIPALGRSSGPCLLNPGRKSYSDDEDLRELRAPKPIRS